MDNIMNEYQVTFFINRKMMSQMRTLSHLKGRVLGFIERGVNGV